MAAADEPRPRAIGTWLSMWMRKPRSAGTWPRAQRRPVSRATTKRLSPGRRQDTGTLTLDRQFQPGHVGDLDRDAVAQVERERQRVEAGAQVRGRGGHVDDDTSIAKALRGRWLGSDSGGLPCPGRGWRLVLGGLGDGGFGGFGGLGSLVFGGRRRLQIGSRLGPFVRDGTAVTCASSTTRAPPSRRRSLPAPQGYPVPRRSRWPDP